MFVPASIVKQNKESNCTYMVGHTARKGCSIAIDSVLTLLFCMGLFVFVLEFNLQSTSVHPSRKYLSLMDMTQNHNTKKQAQPKIVNTLSKGSKKNDIGRKNIETNRRRRTGIKAENFFDTNMENRSIKKICQHGSWNFKSGYGSKVRKAAVKQQQMKQGTHIQQVNGEEFEPDRYVPNPAITAVWEPATQCKHHVFQGDDILDCLSKYRRIVWLGDSVMRGMFWDVVDFFVEALDPSKYEVTVVKRFESDSFTNFEDQDLIIRRKCLIDKSKGQSNRDNDKNKIKHSSDKRASTSATQAKIDYNSSEKRLANELFSIRFTYVSNAIDFSNRCKLIHDWFFQCLDDTRTIMDRVLREEKLRFSSTPIVSLGKENMDGNPIGLLYWNTGLWDWRTGLSAEEFFEAMRSLVTTVQPNSAEIELGWHGYQKAPIFDAADQVIWRTSTASWPSKFASYQECILKPSSDPRPCKLHTHGILEYNLAAIDVALEAGFGVLDTWEITSQRPDASEDGLHFGECKRQRQELYAEEEMGQKDTLGSTQQQSKDINRGCIYRIINQMFFNMICDVRATE